MKKELKNSLKEFFEYVTKENDKRRKKESWTTNTVHTTDGMRAEIVSGPSGDYYLKGTLKEFYEWLSDE